MIFDWSRNNDATSGPIGPSQNGRLRSFVTRHWRGDFSLPVSFWANGLWSTVAITIARRCAELFITPDNHPVTILLIVSAGWLCTAAMISWWLFGIWRSAGNHKAHGGRGFWAGAARIVVILGFLALAGAIKTTAIPQICEYWHMAGGDPDIEDYELQILRGGTELEFIGGIKFGATEDVRRLLDADPYVTVIHLNSGGGRLGEARKLWDLIRERELVTYTTWECDSACTIAFMGGVQRFLAPEARLGFHQGYFPGLSNRELDRLNRELGRWFIAQGAAEWFVKGIISTPSDSMWKPSPEELKRAGVIDGTLDAFLLREMIGGYDDDR
jgi:hypothetical protein